MEQKEIIEIVRTYRKNAPDEYGILRLGVFGSAARDTLTEASDVDIVVELEKPDYSALAGILVDLEKVLGRPVDIIRYRESLHPIIKRRIDAEAVYV